MSAHPSRHSNPFATCWTRPGAIPFLFHGGHSTAALIQRLEQNIWHGAIIGPHGSGKSTLLHTLIPAMQDRGMSVQAVSLHDGQRRLPPSVRNLTPQQDRMLVIDGYEQLGWFARTQLQRGCRRSGCGLLVTSHSRTNIPTLIELAPDECLVHRVVTELTAQAPTTITRADVAASYACHESNVREILFDLYLRHETKPRPWRTLAGA